MPLVAASTAAPSISLDLVTSQALGANTALSGSPETVPDRFHAHEAAADSTTATDSVSEDVDQSVRSQVGANSIPAESVHRAETASSQGMTTTVSTAYSNVESR